MDILEKYIWNDEFWLPNNTKWDTISQYNNFSQHNLIVILFLISILIYTLRLLFERYIAIPFGKYLKIKDHQLFKPNIVLETYYSNKQTISESIIIHLSKETGLKYDEIKEWFEARRSLNKPSQLKKFSECLWRFVFYLAAWVYGIAVLYDKHWAWDTRQFWINYPYQKVTDDIYWYYIIELSFYLSLLVTQFFDVKRKDFWQMFLHHIVTILLLAFSYVCNFVRVGSVILLLHDSADYWLELAKMTTYANYKLACDTSFIIFALVWLLTRLTFFPYKVLYSTTYEVSEIVGPFPACLYFNVLLYCLQVMHIIWFYMILRVAYKAILKGKIEKDDRSESDFSEREIKKD